MKLCGERLGREIRNCLFCNDEFECYKSFKNKFCSNTCGSKHQWKHKREKMISSMQNKPPMKGSTKEKIRQINIGKKHSLETKKKIGESNSGEKHWSRKYGLLCDTYVQCNECNKWTIIQYSSKAKKHFCSKECTDIGQTGNKSVRWTEDKSDWFSYPNEWNNKLKELIRKRDDCSCRICNKEQKELKKLLAVHHIDYDKYNLNEENLISLCNKCHIKTNYNREYWQDQLQFIMQGECC